MSEQSPPDFPSRRRDQRRRGLGKPPQRQFETLEPRRLMATVPLDFYAATPDGEVADVTLQAPLTLDGRDVELRATLDAQVHGANASLYRGGRGLAPLQPGGPASGDGDVWSTHESLVLSYGLWENGMDVTSQFRTQLREAGAAWSNRNDPTLTLSVQDGGTLTFAGSGAWTAGSVAAEPPIELTDKAAGATFQLAASTPGRFFFRSVSLEVTPLGVSETDWQTTVLPGVGSEWTVFVDAGEYLPIQRGPADRLAESRILGEWSTSGSWESWQVRGAASATVAGGAIDARFAPGASTVEIDLPSIALPVPLDMGLFDYIQIGLQVPAGYQQDVTLVYGTSARGANAGRMVLPAAMLAQDGLMHAYRFDLGLEVFYRDNLTSLRIEVPSSGVAGEGVRLDYVEVGDLPGDVLLINSDMNISSEVRAAGDLQRIESKHFATWWSPTVTPSFNPAFHGRNALRMLEESYQVYLKVLGYIEPFYGPNLPTSVEANLATLDFFQAMPAGQALSEFALVTDFVDQGQTLQIRATLDGVKVGQDAGIYRGASGVFPISPGSTSSTDQNSWETREELTLNWQILRQGVDVTADYDVALVGATAEWTNRTAASMSLTLGSDLPAPLGAVTFDGAGADWNTATVAPAEPIVITAGAAGMEINLSPSPSDHFRLRDLRLRIVPEGSDPGDFDGPQIPSAVPRLDLPRYKTNHTTWYDGFWMSAWNGFTYFNVGPGGLMDEGWGNPVPHEYGHAVQGAQPGFLVGGHWESHANYLRENWVGYFAPLFAAGQQAHPSQRVLTNSNFRQDHQRFLYQDYRIHFALQDYATQLGLDPNVAAQLWQFGNRDQTVYDKLAQLLPPDVSLADAIGSTMRYWPTLDFINGQQMKDNLWSTANNRALYDYQVGSMLIPLPDAPEWHRVPLERAPEKFAYMFHELVPQGDEVSIEFRGVDVIGEAEDWRWSLVALDESGTPRYSDVWGPGQHAFALLPGEQRVLLVVVATPSDATLDLSSLYNEKPFDKHPDRLRYPYEVRIQGAEPAGKQLAWNAAAGRFHVNPDGSPGGWVANSATVASTAYVGRDAKVLGTARVEGQARIEDFAVVADNARVRGSAVVSGYAAVINGAIVEDQARVRDRALIRDSARIRGQAVVEDYAIVTEGVTIAGSAIVRGSAEAFYSPSVVSGTAILDYDYSMGWVVSDGVHMNHVPWGGWFEDFFTRTSVKPRGLVASYRVEETAGELLWDEFGAQHAYVRGAAMRTDDAFSGDAALQLNGLDQYVLLDRSVVDLREASFAAWVRPWGSGVQPLLSSSSAAGDYFEVLARDAEGRPAVAIQVDGVRYEAVASSALELGPWAHVGVTFGNGLMTLYVNGESAAQTATPLVPSDALGPNDYRHADATYLGRDREGRLLQGRLDDARFYNVALTADEIAAESARRGAALGRFYATAQLLDGVDDRAESGVPNGLVRTLSADIRPLSSDNVSYYEPVFDSNDELSSRSGSGFGLDNREILVRLDGLGFWRTGVQATLGVWQNVTVTFDGAEAQLFVDGQLRGTRTYQADPSALAAKNYRLGYGQSGDAATRTYFHGEVRNAVIYDRVVTPNAPIPGDFDGDRFVGELDFDVWGAQFGAAAPASDAGPSTSGFDLLDWQRSYGWGDLAESAAAAFAPALDEIVANPSLDAATADPALWWSVSGPAAKSAASRPGMRPAERRPWADVPPAAAAAASVRTTEAAGEDATTSDDGRPSSSQFGSRAATTPLRRAQHEAAFDAAWESWSREQ